MKKKKTYVQVMIEIQFSKLSFPENLSYRFQLVIQFHENLHKFIKLMSTRLYRTYLYNVDVRTTKTSECNLNKDIIFIFNGWFDDIFLKDEILFSRMKLQCLHRFSLKVDPSLIFFPPWSSRSNKFQVFHRSYDLRGGQELRKKLRYKVQVQWKHF